MVSWNFYWQIYSLSPPLPSRINLFIIYTRVCPHECQLGPKIVCLFRPCTAIDGTSQICIINLAFDFNATTNQSTPTASQKLFFTIKARRLKRINLPRQMTNSEFFSPISRYARGEIAAFYLRFSSVDVENSAAPWAKAKTFPMNFNSQTRRGFCLFLLREFNDKHSVVGSLYGYF